MGTVFFENSLLDDVKNLVYFVSTGYYPLNKVELGSAFSLFSFNPVEKFRLGLALRTSNNFSRRLELGGRLAYGFRDEKFKNLNCQVAFTDLFNDEGKLEKYLGNRIYNELLKEEIITGANNVYNA